jgi:hypothetical protein
MGEIRTLSWRPTAAKEKSPVEKKQPRLISNARLDNIASAGAYMCVRQWIDFQRKIRKKPQDALDTSQRFHT